MTIDTNCVRMDAHSIIIIGSSLCGQGEVGGAQRVEGDRGEEGSGWCM